MNKTIKKIVSICTILILTLCFCITAVAQVSSFTDFPTDWSAPAMKYAVEKGLIKGYPDNTIRADVDITRAEMAAVVNRAYGAFIKATKLPFIDVEEGKWFEDTIKVAYNMGTVMGDGNTMRPDDSITREEAFVILARAYSKAHDDTAGLEEYNDHEDIKDWSKKYLSFLSEKGYIKGFKDGNLYPDANLTRAELSQVFYNMITEYVSSQEALDSNDVYDGNIIINGDITLIDGKTFNGDLVIGDGVGTNKILIKNTVIKGTLIIRGATEVKFVNSKVEDHIIVNNPNNVVHFDHYKNDPIFKNIETLTYTDATWKKPYSGGGSSGGVVSYVVTFDTNDGSLVAQQTVNRGTTATKPADPTKTGCTFAGWFTDNTTFANEFDFSTPINTDITLYANWTANEYTITLSGAEGATVLGTMPTKHTYGTATTVPNLEKKGYDFLGWVVNGTGDPVKDLELGAKAYTDPITLTAKWEVQTYDITYVDIEKATYEGTLPTTHTYNTATTVQNVTRTGYDFLGWEINGAGTPVKDLVLGATDYTDDITLKAVWQAQTYTINYVDIAGANEIATLPEDHTYDTATNVPNLTKEKFRFLGWVVNGVGDPVKDLVLGATDYTDVITLTAKWQETVTVTFDTNGGSDIDEQTIDKGTKATKPADPKKGALIFGGWYTDNNTFANEFDFTTEIQEDITLYAKWSVVVKFYYGPVVDEEELVGQTTIAAGETIPEADIPGSRTSYGYYRDNTLSDVYLGEETEHKVVFNWYIKNSQGEWEIFNFDTELKESIELHNIAREANLYVESDKAILDDIPLSVIYNEETPIYESVLDVIFANKNLVETKYDSIEQKEKVINKLIEKGIIDKDYNILNQDRFVKFSIIGEERLDKFVKDNVEKQLELDAEESINSYLDDLIKNDEQNGTNDAKEMLKEIINKELNSTAGKEVVLKIIKTEITKIIDNDSDEFASYIDSYISASVKANNTDSVKELLETHIKKLLTADKTKEFVQNMTTDQVKAFTQSYIDSLTDEELDDWIEDYINGLSDEQLATEIVSYIKRLTASEIEEKVKEFDANAPETELKALFEKVIPLLAEDEIRPAVENYIEGLSTSDLKAEFVSYITSIKDTTEFATAIDTYLNSLTDAELASELVNYINSLDPEVDTDREILEDAIDTYIESLDDDALVQEIVKYMTKMSDIEIENEVTAYFNRDDLDLATEIEIYVDTFDVSYDTIISDYLNEVSDLPQTATDFIMENREPKQVIKDNLDKVYTDAELKEEIVEYILDNFTTELETYVDTYIEEIYEEENPGLLFEDLSADEVAQFKTEFIAEANGNKQDVADEIADKVISDDKDAYVDYVLAELSDVDIETNVKKAITKLIGDSKENYISDFIFEMTVDEMKDCIEDAAVIIAGSDLSDSYKADIIAKVVGMDDKSAYIKKFANKIVSTDGEASYIPGAIDKLIDDGSYTGYVNSAASTIVTSPLKGTYIGKAVNYITGLDDKTDYIDLAADKLSDPNNPKHGDYISSTEKMVEDIILDKTHASHLAYVSKAAKVISDHSNIKHDEYVDIVVGKLTNTSDPNYDTYLSIIAEQIVTGSQRDTFVNYALSKITGKDAEGNYSPDRETYLNTAIDKIMTDIANDKTAVYSYIEEMFKTVESKNRLVEYLADKLIFDGAFRSTNLKTAVDMIVENDESKESVKETIINYVTTDADALNAAIDVAIDKMVKDPTLRYSVVKELAHLIQEHPELMEEILDFAYDTKFGDYVKEFERELNEEDEFTVNGNNLFIMNAILNTVNKFTYEDLSKQFIPEKIKGLIPEDTLKNLYETAYNGFKTDLEDAVETAKNGGVGYVASGVNIEFNPMTEVVIPVFNYYNDLADEKLKDFYYYADNKYLQALIEKINPENLFDKTTETTTLSGYKVKEFSDYYEWFMAVSVLTADTGRWYAENLPKDKAELAQDKLAVKLTDYFNSVLALVNQYSDTKILPSYVDVLEIFENDIPDRFKDKYESLLDLAESRIDVDDTIDKVYDKLAERGIVSKFNTVLDKFIASKYNREITEENIPAVYTIFRRLAGYDDFYTLDSVFNVASEHLTRFEVAEDKYEVEKAGTKVTVERIYY